MEAIGARHTALAAALQAFFVRIVRLSAHLWNRGGQTFPKSTEIRNSLAFRAFFSVFFRPCFSVVAESVSEQLLPRTGGLGGQFWLSKESVSTSATDCRIPAPICTKYGLQKSVHVELMDCTLYIKSLVNTYIRFKRFLMGRLWPPKQAVV